MSENKRQHYRVNYPKAESPTVVLDGNIYPVLDVSEYGIRLAARAVGSLSVGSGVHGVVTFKDDESFLIEGLVERGTDKSVVLQLREPIPYRKIVSEQRRLLSTYPRTAA